MLWAAVIKRKERLHAVWDAAAEQLNRLSIEYWFQLPLVSGECLFCGSFTNTEDKTFVDDCKFDQKKTNVARLLCSNWLTVSASDR